MAQVFAKARQLASRMVELSVFLSLAIVYGNFVSSIDLMSVVDTGIRLIDGTWYILVLSPFFLLAIVLFEFTFVFMREFLATHVLRQKIKDWDIFGFLLLLAGNVAIILGLIIFLLSVSFIVATQSQQAMLEAAEAVRADPDFQWLTRFGRAP